MKKKFTIEGHIFSTKEGKSGIILSYYGKENDVPQGCIWNCDDMEEVKSMIAAVVDPERYPDDEYNERHEIMSCCKW
jgi:hypothetical protein